jgi:hypothetical protein
MLFGPLEQESANGTGLKNLRHILVRFQLGENLPPVSFRAQLTPECLAAIVVLTCGQVHKLELVYAESLGNENEQNRANGASALHVQTDAGYRLSSVVLVDQFG